MDHVLRCLDYIIPYIRIFTRHVFPRIPIKNRVLNLHDLIFHEIVVRASIFLICKRLCQIYASVFFQDLDILANKAENGCTLKKIDKRFVKFATF